MATKIRDIIDYYSGHNVPDEIKERVLDRISNTQDDKEANEAFRELWDKADSVLQRGQRKLAGGQGRHYRI